MIVVLLNHLAQFVQVHVKPTNIQIMDSVKLALLQLIKIIALNALILLIVNNAQLMVLGMLNMQQPFPALIKLAGPLVQVMDLIYKIWLCL